ncbi:MAG: YifB family Mg chelatase-like AAA ATPase [Firmicutes bacterium]|nr:YifB family Mg chelatase-like AAA ATPase [Bacillota bacterium]
MIVVQSGVVAGIEGLPIDVEVDVRPGLPGFEIVGLPSKTVRESRERVRSALRNSGFKFPSQKVIVNLAPAHYRKDGSLFDLPIALGILAHQGVLSPRSFEQTIFVGELSLSGKLKRVNGVLSLADLARSRNCQLVLPLDNQGEIALVADTRYLLVSSLHDLLEVLLGRREPPKASPPQARVPSVCSPPEIKGQAQAKRALELAAHGRHHIMLLGPPGVGKTLLATNARHLLPPPTQAEILIINTIHEVAGLLTSKATPLVERPLRVPHHSISQAALIGGKNGRPGEITLAHCGILLLDEFPEFNQAALQGLRETLDRKEVQISRAEHVLTYPADYWLIATANPCPCGYLGSSIRTCTCTGRDLSRYRRKLRGPLLDRFEMFTYLSPLSEAELRQKTIPWPQRKTNGTKGQKANAGSISPEALDFLHQAQKRLGLSVRGFENTKRLASTIASLEGESIVSPVHMGEALQYRFESYSDVFI